MGAALRRENSGGETIPSRRKAAPKIRRRNVAPTTRAGAPPQFWGDSGLDARTRPRRSGRIVAQFFPAPDAADCPGQHTTIDPAGIIGRIAVLRGRLVIWDSDLAEIYGLPRGEFVQTVCLRKPLPGDFWFQPEREEVVAHGRELRSADAPRYVFTEHGAFVCAQFLKQPEAMHQSVQIVRAFVRLRERTPGRSHNSEPV